MTQLNNHHETSPQSAQLFQLIVENIQDYAIFMTDVEGRLVSWNPGVERLLGYPENEFVGQPISIIFTPEDLAQKTHLLEMETARIDGRAEDKRWHRRKDGTLFWANGIMTALKNEDGALRGFAKVMRDETAQKQAEETLQQSNQHVGNILESINDAFFALDHDWRFIYLNQQTEPLLQRRREELFGKSIWDEFPEAVGTTFEQQYRRAVGEQLTVTFEEFYPPLNTWFEVRAYPSPNGLSVYFHNITARKRREQTLDILADLQKDFAQFLSPHEIMRAAGARIAKHLNLEHCLFVEIDEEAEIAKVLYDHRTADAIDLVGIYRLAEFHTAEERQHLIAGKAIVINDVRHDSRSAVGSAQFEALGIRALVNAPYVSNKRWKFSLSAQRGLPYEWQKDEVELLNELAARIYLRIERARAEETLRKSEVRYRTLFNSIDEGFCVIEVLFDENEKAIDYRFLEINPSFEKLTGIPAADAVREKSVRKLIPNLEEKWFEIYGRVALTGEPIRFVEKSEVMNRWFDDYAFRIGAPEERKVAVLFNNVTERKRAEEKLRFLIALNQILQTLAEPQEIMAMTARMLGEQLQVNRCAYAEVEADEDSFRITGDYTRDTFSIVGEFKMSAFGAEALRLMRENQPYVVNDAEQDPRTAEYLESYRQTEIAAVISVPLHKNGRFAAGMAVHQKTPRNWTGEDIELVQLVVSRCWESIERARANKALRDSEQRFRNMADYAPVMVWVTEPDGTCTYLSQSWYEFTGQTPETGLGFGWVDATHPDDQQLAHDVFVNANEKQEVFRVEYRLRRKDGEYRWAIDSAHPRFSETGEFLGFIGSVIDITERKQGEEALLERARLAALNGAIGTALVREDNLQNVLHKCAAALVEHLDAAFARIWTLNEDEKVLELRASAGMYTHLNGDHARVPIGKFKIGLIAERRLPHLTNEIQNDSLLSDQDWAQREGMKAFAGYPLIVEERLVGVMCVFSRQPLTDLTIEAMASISNGIANGIERKRVEEERQRLLASEQEARRAAENANRLKDEFLATLSHELRTPLNAILGWSQMLKNPDLDQAQVEKALATIERNARSQSQLVDDILDVSRIITGKLRLDVRAVDLSSVIMAAVDAARPGAAAKNIRLQTLIDPQAGPISGDSDRLQQVVWNLLSNAVKFTPKGGRVQIRLERINSHVEIVVSDTGKGIEPDFLPHVFDRFRQSDGSSTRRHGGLGLGLAIVQQLVELHGGTVSVESDGADLGSTFTVNLPLLPVRRETLSDQPRVHPSVQANTLAGCPPELEGLRILVVDDEADSRDLLNLVLNSCGAEISLASSAAEAFEAVQRQRFDVIISDIGMPEEDGFSLIKKIRALAVERGGKVPAIALTAYARAEDRVKALRAGFQMHVPKPVESAELITVVANLAGRTGQPE